MNTGIAIVAGAGGGIGPAVVLELAAAGYKVIAVDRSEPGLKELPDDIHREVADATDPAVPGPLVDRIAAEVGPPDILVNAIGAFEFGDALSVSPQTLDRMMDVNLGSALWLTQAVVPHMQQKGSGAIVHIASHPGVEPMAGVAASAIAKAALVHLTRTLDIELRSSGIRVNAIAPDVVATAHNKTTLPAEMLAGAVEPEAIAQLIGFLVSDAATPVSGAILPIHGK